MSGRPANTVHDLLLSILGCVVDYYADQDVVLPARRLVSAGPPAWDCESVAVWAERTAGHEGDVTREGPTSMVASAGSMLRSLTFGVTITRCSPDVPDINPMSGEPEWPTAATVTEAAREVHYDEPMVAEAIRVGAADGRLPNLNDWALLDWKVVGPLGGFVASEFKARCSTDWVPTIGGS